MIQAKFQVLTNENTPTYYANFIEVAHTPYEFSLIFSKVPTKLKAEQYSLAKNNKAIPIDSMLQIDIPPVIIPGLIHALTVQKELYDAKTVKMTTSQNQKREPN